MHTYSHTTTHARSNNKTRRRVDVTISTEAAPKVLRPSLITEMTLSDGSIHTFEVPMDKFHELRHTAAKMLVDMGTVESHAVLKIA